MPARPAAARTDPLEGIERLLVDGSNLLHAMRRGASGPPAAPPAALIGRLRGVIEMPVRIELMFDGPPDRGLLRDRIAAGVTVRYSGRISADAALARLVVEAEHPSTVLVVTDDVELRHELTRRGARTAGATWLIGRLGRARLESPSVGRARPSLSPPPDAAAEEAADARPGWSPGRGATTKRGNPRRVAKSARPDRDAGRG